MPNVLPPILTAEDAQRYYEEIRQHNHYDFTPLMTIKINSSTTPEIIRAAKQSEIIIAGKLYPEGVTTNSEDGVSDFYDLWSVFEAMEEVDMVLCLHGEVPKPEIFCLDRETEFLKILSGIRNKFPKLRIVLEHISTAAAAQWVLENGGPNTAATVTVHHLLLTLNDVVGGMLQPHHFCKPIAKRPQDRQRLIDAVTTPGQTQFFAGSDTAPHAIETKECAAGCAGVFTAPVLWPLYTEVFERADALDQLETFTSVNGANFYGLPLNKGTMTLVKEPWQVEPTYGGVVPLRAGQVIEWRIKEIN
jgi:dihydroorotase